MKSHLTKYRVPAACLVTILLAGVAPAIATAATTSTHYQSKGLTAHVDSFSFSGSVTTWVYVDATEGLQKDPSTAYVSVWQYDFVANSYACYQSDPTVGIPVTSSQLQVTRDGSTLQSAALNLTGAVLQDCSGNPGNPATATADISISWTGYGASSTQRFNDSFEQPFPGGVSIYRYHSSGMERSATATGSLVIDGTDFFAGVASDPFVNAYLMRSSFLTIDITKLF